MPKMNTGNWMGKEEIDGDWLRFGIWILDSGWRKEEIDGD